MSELPKGWVEITIGNVAQVKGGKRLPQGSKLSSELTKYPYIRVKDFEKGSVNTLNLMYLDEATHLAIKNYTISKSDLYISIAGTVGLVGMIPQSLDGANLTENAAKLCELTGVNRNYLKYVLSSSLAKAQFEDKATSSGQPKLALFRIKDCIFPLAPLTEQKRIVEKLDQALAQVDTIKERLDGIPAILKRFRQSVLAAAVSGKLTEEWRGYKVFSAPKNIDSLITDIRYGTSKKCSETYGSVPVLRIPNIGNGKVLLDNLKYADFDDKELKNLALNEGDLLIIRSNGSVDLVGKLALISSQNLHCLFAGYLIRLRFDLGLVNPKFVALCLQSPPLRQVIELKAKSTSGVNNINTKEISSLEIPVPLLEEQTEIVRLVDQYFAFADTIEKQVQKAQQRVDKLTQSILAKAFRGELVPQDPTDEPADELLKRIATARKEAEVLALSAKKNAKKVGTKNVK